MLCWALAWIVPVVLCGSFRWTSCRCHRGVPCSPKRSWKVRRCWCGSSWPPSSLLASTASSSFQNGYPVSISVLLCFIHVRVLLLRWPCAFRGHCAPSISAPTRMNAIPDFCYSRVCVCVHFCVRVCVSLLVWMCVCTCVIAGMYACVRVCVFPYTLCKLFW